MSTRYASGRRQGITEEMVAALSDYEGGPFTEREKAALRYADQMYVDHHKVDDVLWAALRREYSDDEIFELSWVIAEFIALGKVIRVLDLPFGASAGDYPEGHAAPPRERETGG
jgi:alkylhydroperoxidase family enzyme